MLPQRSSGEERVNPVRRSVYEEQILRCLLVKMTFKEIAPRVGLDISTVRKYVRAPHFLEMLKEKHRDIWAAVDSELAGSADEISILLEENSRKALERLSMLMDSENDHIKLKASVESLDRYKETSKLTKVEAEHHLKIDPTMLVHAAATLKEVEAFETNRRIETRSEPAVQVPLLASGEEDARVQ